MPKVWRNLILGLLGLLVVQALAERGSEVLAAPPETSRPPATHQQPKATAKAKAATPNRPHPKTRRCPVDGRVSFVDSWHNARVGHRHQGVDMMAAWGTRLVAAETGTIGKRIGSMGISGNRLWVYGRTGTRYFYAHLARIDVHAGQHVRVGQQVGLVGNTGNARFTGPHLHFERHPGGGVAVDPYPAVKAWCG